MALGSSIVALNCESFYVLIIPDLCASVRTLPLGLLHGQIRILPPASRDQIRLGSLAPDQVPGHAPLSL